MSLTLLTGRHHLHTKLVVNTVKVVSPVTANCTIPTPTYDLTSCNPVHTPLTNPGTLEAQARRSLARTCGFEVITGEFVANICCRLRRCQEAAFRRQATAAAELSVPPLMTRAASNVVLPHTGVLADVLVVPLVDVACGSAAVLPALLVVWWLQCDGIDC